MSKGDMTDRELEGYYRQVEKELLGQTREQLEVLGYKNSGVTLTRVVDAQGNRDYTFTIHHRKIDAMSPKERIELTEKLTSNLEAAGSKQLYGEALAECSFFHEFLTYE